MLLETAILKCPERVQLLEHYSKRSSKSIGRRLNTGAADWYTVHCGANSGVHSGTQYTQWHPEEGTLKLRCLIFCCF